VITRQAMAAVALLIAAASVAAQPATAPQPETPTATPAIPPKPVAKPAPATVQPTPAAALPAAPEKVALSVPLPRAKPKPPAPWPPSPRLKPEPPVSVASTAPASPALIAPAAIAPTAAVVASGEEALAACGNACAEILFKTVDDCLWVQSANPRPIAFEAQVGGRPMAMTLEGANPQKADEYAATSKGATKKDEAAYHTRLHDPFQSVSAGIAAYRARLGPASACVKSRDEIQRFTASFAR